MRISLRTYLIPDANSYRQQALHHLTRASQPERAHGECELQHLAPRGFEDPVKRDCDQEERDEVQRFVGLLVRRNCVVRWRKPACGGYEYEGNKPRYDL